MKTIIKYSALFLTLFSLHIAFAEEIHNKTVNEPKKELSQEEILEFSYSFGHLSAQLFITQTQVCDYYNGDAFLKGINNYLKGFPCKEDLTAVREEYTRILTNISNNKQMEKKQTQEEIDYRSKNWGWHTAEDIVNNYSNFADIDEYIKGFKGAFNNTTPPLSLQKTMELLTKYLQEYSTNATPGETLAKNQQDIEVMIDSDSLVIIDFYSNKCPPCNKLKPILEELQSEGKTVCFANATEYMAYMQEEKITSIPTVRIYKDGKKVEEFIGFRTKEQINNLLQKYEG